MINAMSALASMIISQNNAMATRRRIEEEEKRKARKVQPTFQSTFNKERSNQERKGLG